MLPGPGMWDAPRRARVPHPLDGTDQQKSPVFTVQRRQTTPTQRRQHHKTLASTTELRQNIEAYILHLIMTTFEPSLSTSLRVSAHDAPSMAGQLPSINFGFEDLRGRMNQFTSRFDDFIEKGRRRLLEERNQFRVNVAEIQGTSFCISTCLHR